jgi:glycosyltransferase involved in cell wall biosynthesis
VLVPRRDPAVLADAVAELIADPLRQRVLGCGARQFIQREYSLDAATRRVEALYREVVTR